MTSINYVVAFYTGKRRSYPNGVPALTYLKEHIDYLTTAKNITGCTFIINKGNSVMDNQLVSEINDFKKVSKLPVKLIVRENIYGSYGAWEQAITETYKDYTHSFLIEDDYIPNIDDIITPFLNKMNSEDANYTASYFNNGHASISNGLLNNSIVENTINKHGRLFQLQKDKCYAGFGSCQVTFLKLIEPKFNDITDRYNTIFLEVRRDLVYGNKNGITLIKPIK
jgi:hypothetical protein